MVTTVVFTLLLSFFWLASLASIIQTYYIYTYFKVQCSVLKGHPFSNISLIQIMKRIQLLISCFYERAFSYFLENYTIFVCLSNIFGKLDPPPNPLTKIPGSAPEMNANGTPAAILLRRRDLMTYAYYVYTMPLNHDTDSKLTPMAPPPLLSQGI